MDMDSPTSTTIHPQPSFEKLHITLSTDSSLNISLIPDSATGLSPTNSIEINNGTSPDSSSADNISDDDTEKETSEKRISFLRDEVAVGSHKIRQLEQIATDLPRDMPSTPSTRSIPQSPVSTQYLHTKMPYEAHPYRSNWATTSHVIEHLQGTIDSLKRELKEQVAKANEERQGKDALNKRCEVSQLELEQLRLENESLNDVIGTKEQRVKQLERDIEQKKVDVKGLENNQLEYIGSKREYEKTVAKFKDDQERSKAAYDSVVSCKDMLERGYGLRFDQISSHFDRLQTTGKSDKDRISRLENIILLQSKERDHLAALQAEIDEEHERHISALKVLVTSIAADVLDRNGEQTDAQLNETTKLVDELNKTYELLRTPL